MAAASSEPDPETSWLGWFGVPGFSGSHRLRSSLFNPLATKINKLRVLRVETHTIMGMKPEHVRWKPGFQETNLDTGNLVWPTKTFSGWEIVLPLLKCLKKPAMQQPNQDFPKWQSPSHKLHGLICLHDPIWLGNFRLNLGKYIYWLVVEPNPSEKYFSSSVGMIFPFPTEWKVIKFMFQTTNQYIYISYGASWLEFQPWLRKLAQRQKMWLEDDTRGESWSSQCRSLQILESGNRNTLW